MINKQLETNVNNERLLEKLAENLNIDFITNGSNLKKMSDAYSSENLNFATNMDEAIANGFLTTMSSNFLEMFGSQNGVYRKNYNNISVYSFQEAIKIQINKNNSLVSSINESYVIYNKGDLIYTDDNIVIESLGTYSISSIDDEIFISVLISLSSNLDSYVIQEGSEFTISSTNTAFNYDVPFLTLTVLRPIGLALLQEDEEDYKLRIYESTYLANNGANSLVSAITKEVPFISHIEVDDYVNGRAIKILYPYTKELILNGRDDLLGNLILPLVETNLKGKILYGQLIEVHKPEPLLVYAEITMNDKNKNPSNSLLNNVVPTFNTFFSTYKTINKEVLSDFLLTELNLNKKDIKNIDFIFTSPYVSEETFNISSNTNDLLIPKGRFLHLTSVTRV